MVLSFSIIQPDHLPKNQKDSYIGIVRSHPVEEQRRTVTFQLRRSPCHPGIRFTAETLSSGLAQYVDPPSWPLFDRPARPIATIRRVRLHCILDYLDGTLTFPSVLFVS